MRYTQTINRRMKTSGETKTYKYDYIRLETPAATPESQWALADQAALGVGDADYLAMLIAARMRSATNAKRGRKKSGNEAD